MHPCICMLQPAVFGHDHEKLGYPADKCSNSTDKQTSEATTKHRFFHVFSIAA